jgi:hypothetical protein
VEAKIVERIKQLWELSYRNGAIAAHLQNEGYDLTEQRVGVLRRKHGFVLRNERDYQESEKRRNNVNSTNDQQPAVTEPTDHYQAQHVGGGVEDFPIFQQQQQAAFSTGENMSYQAAPEHHFATQAETPMNARRRTHETFTEDSEEPTQGKRRRRRIRGHAAQPPDAPGVPPRYKSETSLNECKAYLQLDNERYQAMRQQFTEICKEMNIQKKTKCEAGQWEASKDRLIRENLHLNAVMHIPHPNPDEVSNAIEVICSDVTKRIRVINTTVTIQDANNGLRLNPAESKRVRHIFYTLLDNDGYKTKTLYDDERWEQMFQLWLTKDEALVRITQQGIDAQKLKLLKVLTRDAMKRLTDFRVKGDPSNRNWVDGTYGPGPPPAKRQKPSKPANLTPKQPKKRGPSALGSIPLDPELSIFAPAPPVASPIPLPVEAEFHLAPQSRLIGYHPKVWTGELMKCSVASLHKAGTGKIGAAQVVQVVGMIKSGGEAGEEDETDGETMERYMIETDNDLAAYLHNTKVAADEKLLFEVEMSGGYA